MDHLLIKYILREDNHVDPNFTYLTYGDSNTRKVTQIKNTLQCGSYVFFHTSYNQQEYITAYFYVEKILTKDEHSSEINSLNTDSKVDDIVIIGSRERSKILTYPLPFDKNVIENLKSLDIDWGKVKRGEQSELKTISDSTRSHRKLTEAEKEWLINKCHNRG
ncbi:hypothetical protein [Aneurinibacillus aneurinilyticus]|uniref:EVE domain-containing protein n=1 Tax=Aneurinibacillus aneurinilyticus TaxID=1391 RepID=A0A848CVQ9_ANEAE|nr:hypothetical protein [Aneurinibacillus aneurinilyticus]NME99238.1 hypothetical protein [Aneurinibacillus aneurinilyticus]